MSRETDHTPFGAGELRALRAGDARAAARFERCWRARLVRFCLGYLRRESDAEDAAAEVVCKLLAWRETPDELAPWLLRIARNECLNRLRNAGARDPRPLDSELELAASATGLATRLERAEERAAWLAELEKLSESERELLRLRYGEELSREAIAELVELPPSVVKSRLFEALEKLRARIGRVS